MNKQCSGSEFMDRFEIIENKDENNNAIEKVFLEGEIIGYQEFVFLIGFLWIASFALLSFFVRMLILMSGV